MKNEDTLAVVARYFQYLNAEEWEKMAELWHADARLDASGARLRVGPDAAVEYLRKALAPYALHDDTPTKVSFDGSLAIVEVHYVGTTHDGQDVVIDAQSTYEVADDRILRLTTRYDVERIRQNVTLRPPKGPVASG